MEMLILKFNAKHELAIPKASIEAVTVNTLQGRDEVGTVSIAYGCGNGERSMVFEKGGYDRAVAVYKAILGELKVQGSSTIEVYPPEAAGAPAHISDNKVAQFKPRPPKN